VLEVYASVSNCRREVIREDYSRAREDVLKPICVQDTGSVPVIKRDSCGIEVGVQSLHLGLDLIVSGCTVSTELS